MKEQLELRMYFFVPYNISPIQQAIQAGHAALEYADEFGHTKTFVDFVRYWKTWIILNGGTTNAHRDLNGVANGTLNQIGDLLRERNIEMSYFYEPDLNDALTAVCFIADERVWNYNDYPDFVDYLIEYKLPMLTSQKIVEFRMMPFDDLQMSYYAEYQEWVDYLGGSRNLFLRELIKDKKLA